MSILPLTKSNMAEGSHASLGNFQLIDEVGYDNDWDDSPFLHRPPSTNRRIVPPIPPRPQTTPPVPPRPSFNTVGTLSPRPSSRHNPFTRTAQVPHDPLIRRSAFKKLISMMAPPPYDSIWPTLRRCKRLITGVMQRLPASLQPASEVVLAGSYIQTQWTAMVWSDHLRFLSSSIVSNAVMGRGKWQRII